MEYHLQGQVIHWTLPLLQTASLMEAERLFLIQQLRA